MQATSQTELSDMIDVALGSFSFQTAYGLSMTVVLFTHESPLYILPNFFDPYKDNVLSYIL